MSTTIGGVRIVDMPDLGTFTGTSSLVGEHAGSGRFSATGLGGYFLPLAGGTITGNLAVAGTIGGPDVTTRVFSQSGAFVDPIDEPAGSIASASFVGVLGSSPTPSTVNDFVAAFQKFGGSTSTSGPNAPVFASAVKVSNAAGVWMTGVIGDAQDNAGGPTTGAASFIEGIRGQSRLAATAVNGMAYGVVGVSADTAGATHTYLVGVEGNVTNSTVNAPDPTVLHSFNPMAFTAGVIASSGGSKTLDGYFVVGPYPTTGQGNYGFFVPAGGGTSPVTYAAFKSDAACVYGLDLYGGTYSGGAVRVPNQAALTSENAAGTGIVNMVYVSASNHVVVADSAQSCDIIANATNVGRSGGTLGFNSAATPIAKPAVTGAKGGNAALASLIAALAAYGLVTDSTT